MSDFLTRLAARQIDAVPGLAPRLPSRFEADHEDATAATPVAPGLAADAPEAVSPRTDPVAERPGHEVTDPPARAMGPVAVQTVGQDQVRHDEVAPGPPSAPRPAAAPPEPLRDLSTTRPSALGALPVVEEHRRDTTTPQVLVSGYERADGPPLAAPRPPAAPASATPRDEHERGLDPLRQPPAPPRRPPAEPLETRRESPVVTVTIGRLEVRAVIPPQPRERPKPDGPTPLSLEDYLGRRHGARS